MTACRSSEAAHQAARGWVAYGLRELVVEGMLPDVRQIETTSFCNLRCTFCPYDEMTRERRAMDLDCFERFVDEQCGHVEAVGLHHFGEPFLNEELPEYVAACSRRGIRTTVSTNATRVTRLAARAVFEAGLTRLIVSLDGAGPETYEALRVGARYEEVVRNVGVLLEAKAGLDPGPFIQMQFILTPENERESTAFRRLWDGRPGVDQVVLRRERSHAGQRVRHDRYEQRSARRLPCRYLWESVVILVDGRVVPCCKDFDGKEVLGNVFEGDTLESIWNGKRMRELREAHVRGDFSTSSLCAGCDEWRGHTSMSPTESREALRSHVSERDSARAMRIFRPTFENS